jgi:hypothetical protein
MRPEVEMARSERDWRLRSVSSVIVSMLMWRYDRMARMR